MVQKYFKNSSHYEHKRTIGTLKRFLKDHGVRGLLGSKAQLTLKAYEVIKNMKDFEVNENNVFAADRFLSPIQQQSQHSEGLYYFNTVIISFLCRHPDKLMQSNQLLTRFCLKSD